MNNPAHDYAQGSAGDTQFITEHLKTFGAYEVSRRQYSKMLDEALTGEARFDALPPGLNGEQILAIARS